ncbi:hypothetical protein [Rhizobium rhizogenes]|uniref:hypothetical protein n=1 Tax=Rhizobium rhizogenes TaxID=359 RepID=UPI001571B91F|nr:hypothetical protein [Rhizobium rhizogenes]NTF80865.1 hypothetical protein [Rhizobium rhizogenes]
MSWASKLLAVLAESSAAVTHEDDVLLTVELGIIPEVTWHAFQSLRLEQDQNNVKLRLSEVDAGDGHNLLDDSFDELVAQNFRLFCAKAPIPNSLRFFYQDRLIEYAVNKPGTIERCNLLLVADINELVITCGLEVQPWTSDVIVVPSIAQSKSPRALVNDSTGLGIVPANILVWLPRSWPNDEVEKLFGKVTARRLALSLATSIFTGSGGEICALADLKRKVTGPIENPTQEVWQQQDFKAEIYRAAAWVYNEGTDSENRHAILSSEIARSFPKGKAWGEGLHACLDGALDSAKIAYRLHLYDKSVDALKLMSDLRKGLADDVKAVSAQTSALAAGLWKDAAVVLGAVAIKSFSSSVSSWILILTAAYLLISCYLNKRVAARSVATIQTNEKIFRRKLYSPILANDEYDELAGNRYTEIISEFDCFKTLVSLAYYVAACLFIILALWPHWQQIQQFSACSDSHFARYIGRLFMPDARPFFPFPCTLSWQ